MKKITPSTLSGEIFIQGSKSVSHRSIICAGLSRGISTIKNLNYCDDIYATLTALKDLGKCNYEIKDGDCIIEGGLSNYPKEYINCEESGSTIRFLLPLAKKSTKFIGNGRLLKRPMNVYYDLGLEYEIKDDYLEVKKEIEGGEFFIKGNVSSQFISGLLFALPLAKKNSIINITTKVESIDYIKLTQQMQEYFNVQSDFIDDKIFINKNQIYKPKDVIVEGDYSHGAFFAVAGAIGGDINIKGLRENSLQGDKEIFNIIKKMGGSVKKKNGGIQVCKSKLHGIDIDASQIPDLVPIIAVLACACKGSTKIYNAARLRIKESDRLLSISTELNKLGGKIKEYKDSLVIEGVGKLNGGEVFSHMDHRIAMALSVAACISIKDVILFNEDVIAKSAKNFYNEVMSLGGKIQNIN